MEAKPAFEIQIDIAANVARAHFRYHLSDKELQAGLAQVESLLGRMRPNFTVLADMSELELMDLDCVSSLAKLMDLCRDHGVGKIVRVIPDPAKDIGVNILSIIHYRGKVQIATHETLAEAEKELK